MRALRMLGLATGFAITVPGFASPVFFNEIHYDNAGTDTNEAIEIAGPAGTDLTGWQIVRYNGSNGLSYVAPPAVGSETLSQIIPDQQNGFGTVVVQYTTNGLQNGAPDGIALVDDGGTVVQFLSYEGAFTAGDGPANGLTSTDIGVGEPPSAAIGLSLQLAGVGSDSSDFAWQSGLPSTFGAVNAGQTFLSALASPVINEVLASHAGTDDTEFVELYGMPGSLLAGLSLIVVEGDAIASQGDIDRRIDFGPGDAIGANGFFLVGNATGLGANYGVTPDLGIGDNFLENGSLTVALVETSTLSGGSITGAETVIDAVALTDGDAGDQFFLGAPVLGPDGSFFPAGARRIADGVDTDSAADWVLADFALGVANTPTAASLLAVPEPGTLALLGLGFAGIGWRSVRRRRG